MMILLRLECDEKDEMDVMYRRSRLVSFTKVCDVMDHGSSIMDQRRLDALLPFVFCFR
jgi:hypothetical protein